MFLAHEPLSTAEWRRSSRCESGHCVEVAFGGNAVGVRDSQDHRGPILVFDPTAWRVFAAAVRRGEFDRP